MYNNQAYSLPRDTSFSLFWKPNQGLPELPATSRPCGFEGLIE